jgi:hypothetical protein
MQINEVQRLEKISVVLQRNVDFVIEDLELGEFAGQIIISDEKLQEIAKTNGFDKCSKCKNLMSFDQEFVNAVFVKFIN